MKLIKSLFFWMIMIIIKRIADSDSPPLQSLPTWVLKKSGFWQTSHVRICRHACTADREKTEFELVIRNSNSKLKWWKFEIPICNSNFDIRNPLLALEFRSRTWKIATKIRRLKQTLQELRSTDSVIYSYSYLYIYIYVYLYIFIYLFYINLYIPQKYIKIYI